MKKDILKISDLNRDDIVSLVTRAVELKKMQGGGEQYRPLVGKTLAMIFQKSSTRTRVSFEVGMTQLGGNALFLSPQDTQIGRGELIKDTARVLSRYVDGILIRTFSQDEVEELAYHSSVPVINGLSDLHHPCQILGDLMTAHERGKDLFHMKVCYLGDGNNVANSWVEAAALIGFRLVVACPKGYEPHHSVLDFAGQNESVSIERDPIRGVENADILYTDVWISMGQEDEVAKREDDFSRFQLNSAVVDAADPAAIVMHCLPAYRGKEITDEVMEGEKSVVFDQAENRLHIQKALLERVLA
ncbi:MAG: ornithine carbamoyltransferase [Deltaproteobacteria bacterium]|nr:ornithine carbamoyltransferase [Deltaproteobacteria bacterium]NIS76393.1 ornithine carbamoyltransferase [Deltaproteobacteria bacterium]